MAISLQSLPIMRRLLTLSAVVLACATPAAAQMTMAQPAAGRLTPAASPRAMTVLSIGTGVRGAAPLKVTVDYGQPFARGRAVEGGLIPNGQVWRTGANAATAFTTVRMSGPQLVARWKPKKSAVSLGASAAICATKPE